MTNTNNQLKTRHLIVRLILNNAVFPNTNGSNSKIIRDLAMDITINKESGILSGTANVTIYGMLDSDIRAFTRFKSYPNQSVANNTIEIYAGYNLDPTTQLPPLAYIGPIWTAGVDYNDPNRPFTISSTANSTLSVANIPNTEIKGNSNLNNILNNMVAQYNKLYNEKWIYTPNDVIAQVTDQTYTGSLLDQMTEAATAYKYKIQPEYPIIYVYKSGSSPTKLEIDISPQTGLLGYPRTDDLGISCRVRYNPSLHWGAKVSLKSSIFSSDSANSCPIFNWYINSMTSTLQNRGNKWETLLKLNTYQDKKG